MGKRFGLPKKEKLKSRKAISELFDSRNRLFVSPLQVWYGFRVATDDDPVLKIGVSCSKKQFKKAVDRNRVKRLLREAYRLQRNHFRELLEKHNRTATLFFVYSAPAMPDYKDVYEVMGKSLKQLEKKLLHESVL